MLLAAPHNVVHKWSLIAWLTTPIYFTLILVCSLHFILPIFDACKREKERTKDETATSRTRSLKQMIQRRNELGEYIVAINLNAHWKSYIFFFPFHSLQFSSSSSHIPRVRSHFEPHARIHRSFFLLFFLCFPDAFSTCSSHSFQSQAMVRVTLQPFHNQVYAHKYGCKSVSWECYSKWDYKSLLCDRKLLICHFCRQMTRWNAQCTPTINYKI